jgi:hypothetical protein
MGARETSLNVAVMLTYFFGLFSFLWGLAIFNGQHPYSTGVVCLGLFILGTFPLTVARGRPGGAEVKYIGDGFAGTQSRIQKFRNAVSLGCTAIFGHVNTRFLGEEFTL